MFSHSFHHKIPQQLVDLNVPLTNETISVIVCSILHCYGQHRWYDAKMVIEKLMNIHRYAIGENKLGLLIWLSCYQDYVRWSWSWLVMITYHLCVWVEILWSNMGSYAVDQVIIRLRAWPCCGVLSHASELSWDALGYNSYRVGVPYCNWDIIACDRYAFGCNSELFVRMVQVTHFAIKIQWYDSYLKTVL